MNRRTFSRLVSGAILGTSLRPPAAAAAPLASAPFSFSVMLWTIDSRLPVERCIEIAARAGYRGVELVHEFDPWSNADYRRIRAQLDSLHLVCDSIACTTLRLADPGAVAANLEAVSRHMESARRLDCPQLIVTSGARMEGLSPDAQRAACLENLQRIADLAARRGIEVVVEPIDRLEQPHAYLASVAEGFDLVRSIGNPHVKILYDFYHEQRAAGNLIEKFEANVEWVGLVHIADVPGRHEPGTGEIDYRNIYRSLAERNYRRFVAMEYLPTLDPLPSLTSARVVAEQASRSPARPYLPA